MSILKKIGHVLFSDKLELISNHAGGNFTIQSHYPTFTIADIDIFVMEQMKLRMFQHKQIQNRKDPLYQTWKKLHFNHIQVWKINCNQMQFRQTWLKLIQTLVDLSLCRIFIFQKANLPKISLEIT